MNWWSSPNILRHQNDTLAIRPLQNYDKKHRNDFLGIKTISCEVAMHPAKHKIFTYEIWLRPRSRRPQNTRQMRTVNVSCFNAKQNKSKKNQHKSLFRSVASQRTLENTDASLIFFLFVVCFSLLSNTENDVAVGGYEFIGWVQLRSIRMPSKN